MRSDNGASGVEVDKAAPTLGPEPEPGPPVFVAFEQKDVAS